MTTDPKTTRPPLPVVTVVDGCRVHSEVPPDAGSVEAIRAVVAATRRLLDDKQS